MNIKPVRYDINIANSILKYMCKLSPYTVIKKNCKTKKKMNYIWIKNNTQIATQKLSFSGEPQDPKSSDPQALGVAQLSDNTNEGYSSLST